MPIYVRDRRSTGGGGGTPTPATSIIVERFCLASLAVGDIVYQSLTVNNQVVKTPDNFQDSPSIGIAIEKTSDTTVKVLTYGQCDITFGGLSKGKRVFLSSTGTFTIIRPTTGYLQFLGYTNEDTKVFFNPQLNRAKLTPFV